MEHLEFLHFIKNFTGPDLQFCWFLSMLRGSKWGVKIILVHIVKNNRPFSLTQDWLSWAKLSSSSAPFTFWFGFGLHLGVLALKQKKQQHKNQKGKGSCGSADIHCPKRRLLWLDGGKKKVLMPNITSCQSFGSTSSARWSRASSCEVWRRSGKRSCNPRPPWAPGCWWRTCREETTRGVIVCSASLLPLPPYCGCQW